jgi:SAM-dependent methyltransferase
MIGDILKTAVKYAKRFLGLFVNFFTEISWIVDDAASDGRLGIHTCRESHDIKQKSRYEDGVFYKATHYSLLRKLFREHPLKTSDVFVDYGCGRGRVVCVAARERVKKVIGVELQSQFVEEARANAARVKGAVSPIEIVKEDAASYDPGEGSVFFFYDSFG